MLIALITLIIGLFFCVIAGSRNVLVSVLLTRSIADPVFELTKGSGMGMGGGINLLILAIALKAFLRSPHVALPSAALIWFPFLLAILPCAALAPSLADGFRWHLTVFSYFCVFVLPYYYISTEDDFFKFMQIVLFSSLIPVFLTFVLPLQEFDGQMRPASTFSHPNVLALYLVAILLTCFYLLQELPQTAKTLCLAVAAYIPIVILAIFMTKTRSAWMATGLLLGVYAVVFDRRYLLYIAAGAIMATVSPAVLERILDLGQGNVNEDYAALNSYAWRLTLWNSALEWATDNRWFGYGATTFRHYMPWFFPLPLPDEQGLDAHSSYVQLLFEAGYVGISGFIYFLIALLMALFIYRNKQNYSWLLCVTALAGYALVSSSDNVMQYLSYNWYFFFLMGAICAYGIVLKKRRRYSPEPVPPLALAPA